MRRYKALAVQIQEKLNQIKLSYLSDTSSYTESDSVDYSSSIGSLFTDESVMKFSEDCQSDVVNMLGDKCNGTPCKENVPSDDQVVRTHRQLSHTIEENKKVFPEEVLKMYACADEICDSNVTKLDKIDRGNGESNDGYVTASETVESENVTPVKLIRSRSFILEKPSPFLLAQLQNMAKPSTAKRKTWKTPDQRNSTFINKLPMKRCNSTDERKKVRTEKRRFSADESKRNRTESFSSVPKRKGWDLKNARAKWSSIENDLGSILDRNKFVNKKFSSLPTSPNSKMFRPKTTPTPVKFIDPVEPLNFSSIASDSSATLDETVIAKTPPKRNVPNLLLTPRKSSQSTPRRIVKGFVTPSKSSRVNLFNIRNEEAKKSQTVPRPIAQRKINYASKPLDNKPVTTYFVSEKDVSPPIKTDVIIPERETPVKRPVQILFHDNKYDEHESSSDHYDSPSKSVSLNSSSRSELKDLFDKMQQIQRTQLVELIRKQKEEQEMFIRTFQEQQTFLLSKLSELYPDNSDTTNNNDELVKSSETLLTECKRLLNNNETISPVCDKIDFVSESIYSSNDTLNDANVTFSNDTSTEKHSISNDPHIESKTNAATKINAAVRGYLTRRLFKSERVQTLIQTIKDTLLCAMELHHENVEKIQPADIELHRRLIQQVTAACVAFHDVFFMLSTKEQMAVIALDRRRKREKLLKPLKEKSPSLTSTTQRRINKKMIR